MLVQGRRENADLALERPLIAGHEPSSLEFGKHILEGTSDNIQRTHAAVRDQPFVPALDPQAPVSREDSVRNYIPHPAGNGLVRGEPARAPGAVSAGIAVH